MSSTVSKTCALFFLAISASSCATISPSIDRYAYSDRVAALNGFEKSFIKTDRFVLASYSRFKRIGAPVRIYIEGDGVSWVSRTQLSDDPTPREPLVLELAAADPAENTAYIGRPGQYSATGAPQCDSSYWSGKRFSDEVVASMDEAVNRICLKANSDKIDIIGYSGGAAIAVLIASRRADVASLRTIAGNLDTDALSRYHRVSPLSGSLNPIEAAGKIKGLPQRHFVGSKDTIVPLFITQSFVERSGEKDYNRITVIDGVTHAKGWRERWRQLLSIDPF